uniref:Uncharacterized protein n=1 Tax=Quercus lobata TaxID=97700 RepID=A0A7N2L923_QUELO
MEKKVKIRGDKWLHDLTSSEDSSAYKLLMDNEASTRPSTLNPTVLSGFLEKDLGLENFRDLFVGVLNSDDSELADRFTMLSSLPQLVFRFEHWVLPNLPFHKAKFDGALFRDSSSASIAVVVGDFEGNVIRALFERIGLPASVVEVEALACRRAVSFAIEIDKLAKKARYLLLPQFGLEEIPVDVSPFVMQDKFYVKSLIKFHNSGKKERTEKKNKRANANTEREREGESTVRAL